MGFFFLHQLDIVQNWRGISTLYFILPYFLDLLMKYYKFLRQIEADWSSFKQLIK